jgi:hypothetical protein
MRTRIFRIVLGCLVALALIVASIETYGFLVAWRPVPSRRLVECCGTGLIYGTQLLAILPYAFAAAFALRFLLGRDAILASLACVAVAWAVTIGLPMTRVPAELVFRSARELWLFELGFFGAVLVLAIRAGSRSNKHWSGP